MTYLQLSSKRRNQIEESGQHSERAFQTTVFTSNGIFRVSSCYRLSSSIYPSWYYETFIYKFNEETKKEDWIGDETDNNHLTVVEQILKDDDYKESSGDE